MAGQRNPPELPLSRIQTKALFYLVRYELLHIIRNRHRSSINRLTPSKSTHTNTQDKYLREYPSNFNSKRGESLKSQMRKMEIVGLTFIRYEREPGFACLLRAALVLNSLFRK